MKIFLTALLLLTSLSIFSQVQVKGYYRSNGTYVKPHIRSSPDSTRSNNYGASGSGNSGFTSPSSRDFDGDGISNQYDNDDDNDGISDDYDSNQYGN